MPHFESTCSFYDDDIEDAEVLPPYSHRQVPGLFELPEGWSSFRELPGPMYMPLEMFNRDACHELQASFPNATSIQMSHINTSESRSVPPHLETSSKWDHPAVERGTGQAFASLRRPARLPTLSTEQPLGALPAMTKEGSSHESSPISPYTPGQDASHGDLKYLSSSLHNGTGTVLSRELTSPGPSLYAAPEQPWHPTGMQGYFPLSSQAAQASSSPTEASASSTPTMEYFSHRLIDLPDDSAFSFDDIVQQQQSSHESVTQLQSTPYTGTPWYSSEDPRLGTWESDTNSRWYRRPLHGEVTEVVDESNYLSSNNTFDEHEQAAQDDENGDGDVRPDGRSNPEPILLGPLEVCDLCGTEFTGRYRKGNLKRHVREKHGLSKSLKDKVCRICKHVFKRSDATRKHEWKRHRLVDTKPNKRRKR